MNAEEAIKFLNEIQDENIELQEEGHNKLLLEVINLLKRGEEYGIDRRLTKVEKLVDDNWCEIKRIKETNGDFIKQEYSPKPKSDLVRLLKELDKAVKEILEEI